MDRARRISVEILAPCANALDQGDIPPIGAVHALAEAGLLGLTTPVEYGGHGAPGAVVREYTELLASACGTTTFVQGQHLSACMLIASSANDALKTSVLRDFATGRRIIGVAFAHVRRPGPPMLRVERVENGYLFNGTAAWFTGWGVMTDVLIAGTLPDGQYLYAVVPLDQAPNLTATPPMRLCTMNASGTVSLICKDLIVPASYEVKSITPEEMSGSDAGAILGLAPQVFGVTRASIELLNELGKTRRSSEILDAAKAAESELDAARAEVDEWRDKVLDPDYKQRALGLRAWFIEMGVRSAHMAVAAVGGAANNRDHTAQRLFREAMFYTLTAQTRDVRNAELRRLTSSALRDHSASSGP